MAALELAAMTLLEREDVEQLQAEVCRAVHDVAGAVRLLAFAAALASMLFTSLLTLFVLTLSGAL